MEFNFVLTFVLIYYANYYTHKQKYLHLISIYIKDKINKIKFI